MNCGTTPMILAVRLAIERMVEDLINTDADINAADDSGKNITEKGSHICLLQMLLIIGKHKKNSKYIEANNGMEECIFIFKNYESSILHWYILK